MRCWDSLSGGRPVQRSLGWCGGVSEETKEEMDSVCRVMR